ncbi:MAG: hypothetical protein KBS83_08945 [Lachnospiraceae bacterium]|nr:hypothetical protein [Candidatus Equihabitans merdae]
MGKFYQKLEKTLGRFAIPHLTLLLIVCYVIGYILEMINPSVAAFMTLEPYYILHGQVWRLLTWIVIPPTSLNIFTAIMLFFYLSIGRILEQAWGLFRYNLYLIGGMLITLIAAFACYGIFSAVLGTSIVFGNGYSPFSTYYICTSIFLGFAATFPDVRVNLYFIIPIKVKWLGIVYLVLMGIDLVQYISIAIQGNIFAIVYIVAMLASILNFFIFLLLTANIRRISPSEIKRRRDFQQAMQRGRAAAQNNGNGSKVVSSEGRIKIQPRHSCVICGKTDLTDPDMDFRFCSKCQGACEYCSEHLYTHIHKQ